MLQSCPMRRTIQPILALAKQLPHEWKAGLLMLPCLLPVACSAVSPLTTVGEGPLGAVALERLASRGTTAKYGSPQSAFQASHPATVPAPIVSRLLSGLSVSGLDRPAIAVSHEPYPLFSQEEAEFFTPLIVRALSQAEPDQRVRFTLQDDGRITQGTLYLHRTILRVSLSHYRASRGQSASRPATLTLSFTPSEALVRDDVPQSWMNIEPEQPRVAVALEGLNQLSTAMPAPAVNKPVADTTVAPTASGSDQTRLQQELQATKDVVVKQAQELQSLKSELESLRRQLAEKESAAPKAKPKTPPRKTSPAP